MPENRGRSRNDTIGRWNVNEISGDTWSGPRFNLMTITWSQQRSRPLPCLEVAEFLGDNFSMSIPSLSTIRCANPGATCH